MVRSIKFRVKKNKRQIYHQCPNCMSELKVEEGEYVCTGDQLTYWKKEIERFKKMELSEQRTYLSNIADESRFNEMLKQGSDLTCGFNTRIVNIMPTYSEQIPDPMVVDKMERSLGRRLTDEELENVPKINFPDDV